MRKEIQWESIHIDDIEANSGLVEEEDIPDGEEDKYVPVAGKLISTPVGIYELDDKYNPLRQFELRRAYTNFNISEQVAEIIDDAPGVEAFAVLTRYSFIIGVGKLFSFDFVRKYIEEKLLDKPEYSSEIVKLSKELNKNHKYWALYEFPNGEIDSFGVESEEEYKAKIQVYTEAASMSGGKLLTWEEK